MDRGRCAGCGDRCTPRRNVAAQRYCSKPECQRQRRRRWQRQKLSEDPDYRANQAAAQRRWRAGHPQYWRGYRQRHPLELRFAPLRLRDPERLARLSRSLRQHGQLMPVVGVAEGVAPPGWVLIDGYRRREALGEIGEDRVWVDVWERSVDEALLLCLGPGDGAGLGGDRGGGAVP
jgi:hypothetical protein